MRKKENLLEATRYAAEQFLRSTDWRDVIDAVLEKLGSVLDVSHAYLAERRPGPNEEILSSMYYQWTAPGFEPNLNVDAHLASEPGDAGYERYYAILDSGAPLEGSSSLFTESERRYWNSINIKALLEMRIIVDDQQWGVIGFDEMKGDRDWTPSEVDLIKVAANVLGAVIKRQLDEEALKVELEERRRAESSLRFSEEKFSKAFHTAQVLMTIEGTDHRFIEVNNAFQKAIGRSREEIIGHTSSELNMFFDDPDSARARKQLRESEIVKDFEVQFRRSNGEIGTALLTSEWFFVDQDRYLLTSGLDITEQKKTEEKYRSIFNNSMDGIFQSTEYGRFISVNPAMARIYGYDSPEDMLNSVNNIEQQVYVDARERDEVRRLLNSGEKLYNYETLDLRKDGSRIWISMTVQGIFDKQGNLEYYEGTVEDITFRKQVEAEREKFVEELANKNAELEQFTYTVSHDLKSPLFTITGFLSYLEQDALSGNIEQLKKDVHRIQDAVLKMQRLLNELLELSRVGRIINEKEKVSFNELVKEAVELVQGRLDERGVTLQIDPDLPVVYGDRPRLIEVLQNLIDNAAKYMGTQSRPVIEIGQRGGRGDVPVLYVKDNGIGIDAEHHEQIFGLFTKLDATSEGTGIGLALVKRIIEFHGGRIWVESEPGSGSTFFFTLPSGPEA